MQIPLTPEQYQAAVKGLLGYRGSELISFSVEGNSGTIQTSQIDANFTFNGTNALDVEIISKHGFWVKRASDATIQSHLTDFIMAEVGS